jgi:hypothetical protein
MFKGAVPIDKLSLTCTEVQEINKKISRGDLPEDKLLRARVMAHTIVCESCRTNFKEETSKAKREKEESKN